MQPATDSDLATIRRRILRWYREHRRDLPWRTDADPYRVWVSEIMLQQTRVEAVIPYYDRFLARFPDVQTLADAPEAAVLALWSGLGYYRRARLLHEAARKIRSDHGGHFPQDETALRALPGVGRYTAGAILSIAFGRRVPVLDGNVERVLCRLFALDGDPRRAPRARQLWELAARLADSAAPGDLNQGLMELGATICTAGASARCTICPLSDRCRAYASGGVADLPALRARPALQPVTWGVLLVERQGRWLCWPRQSALMNGLWEFPTFQVDSPNRGENFRAAVLRAAREELSTSIELGEELAQYRQAISGRAVTQRLLRASLENHEIAERARWLRRAEIESRAITTATRRLLHLLDSRKASSGKSARAATATERRKSS